MAGTVTTTEEVFSNVKKITFAWICSAGGAADATTTKYYTGDVLRAVAIPDGTTAPTALYDVVVNDDDSVDVLDGAFANLSATLTTQVGPLGAATVANAKLTLAVTAAGDTKKGKIILYIR